MKKRNIVYSICLIVIITLLSSATIVNAWLHSGHYFEGYVLPDPLYFVIDSNTSTESWVAWYNAHEEWNEATNSPTNFYYNTSYDIIYCFQADSSPLGISGKCFYSPPFMGEYTSADVTIYEDVTDDFPYYKRVAVAAHEFGHALGLDDLSSGSALMLGNDDRYPPTYAPTSDDINGINALY